MNKYKVISVAVEVFHVIVIILWIGGFFVPRERYPEFRHFHAIFGVTVFFIQLLFSMRCPLTLLAGYFEELGNHGFVDNANNKYLYKPFIITILRKHFGFNAPGILIMIITVIGTGVMMITILS